MCVSTTSTAPGVMLLEMIGLPFLSFLPVSVAVTMELNSPMFDDPVLGSSQRLKLWAASAAVNSSPFDHLTPLRMCIVQVLRSSEASQRSQR